VSEDKIEEIGQKKQKHQATSFVFCLISFIFFPKTLAKSNKRHDICARFDLVTIKNLKI